MTASLFWAFVSMGRTFHHVGSWLVKKKSSSKTWTHAWSVPVILFSVPPNIQLVQMLMWPWESHLNLLISVHLQLNPFTATSHHVTPVVQSIKGDKYGDKQPFTLTFKPMVSLEWTVGLTHKKKNKKNLHTVNSRLINRFVTPWHWTCDFHAVRQDH